MTISFLGISLNILDHIVDIWVFHAPLIFIFEVLADVDLWLKAASKWRPAASCCSSSFSPPEGRLVQVAPLWHGWCWHGSGWRMQPSLSSVSSTTSAYCERLFCRGSSLLFSMTESRQPWNPSPTRGSFCEATRLREFGGCTWRATVHKKQVWNTQKGKVTSEHKNEDISDCSVHERQTRIRSEIKLTPQISSSFISTG